MEAISKINVEKEEKKESIKPDSKTGQYQRFTGLFNEQKEKNIEEIEDDVLKLYQAKEKLKKENPTKEEKEAFEKKEKEYDKKFQEARDKTIDNIKEQLKENKLNITELDDHKNLGERVSHDPLKFFVASPLNKVKKARDPSLSVEEREQLNLEASSLFKYALFNGCMMMLFTFFLSVHPAFFDRTNPLFQSGTPGTR
ncbi:1839_t:CDS:2 [Diversispora eburnea]|uniref:1839_t:CDS:1 n=1 Tax=Diversispora eburnea TaxID=1213867 RepID=A0A9N9CCJ5_9GLOM|nr:1839_t:CDS:2 [Diversispora eburnea]